MALATSMVKFEDPLLTGLSIPINFLVVLLLDQLVSIVVQCSNERIHRRRGRYGRDDGRLPHRRDCGLAQAS